MAHLAHYREAHPLPFVITHWINLVAMILLIFTGFYIKYYLFFKKDHPLAAKLGVPQKISYLLIPVLIILMFYTGCALWVPTADLPLFAAGTNLVGGLMSMRIIHYFMMFVFICFMFIHVYLANVEGIAPSLLMFFHKEHGGLVYDPDLHNIIGEDDLGHGEKH